jgi:HKD family nuclease
MAQIEFFHPVIDTQSVNKISEIMSWAEKSLQIEMCYVTEFGTSLLEKHADHLFRDGSFIIVANESMNDIEGLNELAKKRPKSLRFVTAKSDSKEKSVEGLMHAKLIYAENGDDCIVWVGSHNFTRRALLAENIEAALIISGKFDEQVFVDVREHLKRVKELSEEGQIPCEPELIPVNEVIIIECEASPRLIEQLRSRKQSYTVYLRHNKYDDECIPAARRNREVRLYVYNENDLTNFGPINPPAVIRTGRLNGVTFTKNSPRNGTSASWEDRPGYEHMTINHKTRSDPTSALVVSEGKIPDDEAWTISAFVIDDNPVNELFLADKLKPCLVGDESKREVRFDRKVFEKSNEIDLIKGNSSQEIERDYVTFIRNQRPGYNSKYYGTVENIHYKNLTKWAAKKGIQVFPAQSKEPYLFIRLGYILDTSKE